MAEPSNIYIVGAQSTGKTTLVTALADHFNRQAQTSKPAIPEPTVITEVARGVLKRHHFNAVDIVASKSKALELQRRILQAQAEAEGAVSDGWYISDRSGLDPLVYARRYVGLGEMLALQQEPAWQFLRDRMKAGLVIVCEAGGEWLINDGVRLMPDNHAAWLEMHRLFCDVLNEVDIRYAVLPSTVNDLESRVSFVIEKWEAR